MSEKIAACIINGIVVNTSVFNTETSQGWLDAVSPSYDKVLLVDNAGIGWEEYQTDKLRPIQPSDKYFWNDEIENWEKISASDEEVEKSSEEEVVEE